MSSVVRTELDSAHEQSLERCCAALEAEIARQAHVLEICQEQGRAARSRDVDALESATRELAKSINGVLHAEAERLAAVMDAARGLGVGPEDLRLSRLIAHAPEPWRGRLLDIQRRMKTVIGVTQRLVEANGRFFREGARTAERLLVDVIGDAPSESNAYDQGGRTALSALSGNALLNVAG